MDPGDTLLGMQNPNMTPEQDPEYTSGGAPGGPNLGSDLPSVSVIGGPPATTGGFSPSPAQDPLPPPGSTEGSQTPPSGVRR